MAMPNYRSSLITHAVAFVTIIIWGITFVSTKILLKSFTPMEILFLRFAIGWLALWCLYPQLGIKLPWSYKIFWHTEILYALAGLTGVTLYFLFENIALTYTLTANVSVIVSTTPFFTGLFAWLFLKTPAPGYAFFLGFIISMAGIILISFSENSFQINPMGDSLAFLAALLWGIYSILTRQITNMGAFNSLVVTRHIFFYGLIFMLPCFLVTSPDITFAKLSLLQNWGNLIFLGVGASALCFASWTWCVKRLGPTLASAWIYLVPVVSIITSAIVLNEHLTPAGISGCILTITGLILAESASFKNLFKK